MTIKGATIRLTKCTDCVLSNLTLRFPSYSREVKELNAKPASVASTLLDGTRIALTNISLTQSNNHGLVLRGDRITVDNCLVSFTDWLGSLTYHPLGAVGNQISVRRCTVHDFGNAGVVTNIPNSPPAAQGQPQEPPRPMAVRDLP